MDPAELDELKKLSEAVHEARDDLQSFRHDRYRFIAQFVGSHYSSRRSALPDFLPVGENGDRRIPVDMLEQAVSTYTRYLAANSPQVTVSTKQRQLRSSAMLLEMALNHLLKEINFQQTIEKIVQDAMFGPGIVKIGISDDPDSEEIEGPHHDYPQPFADPISLDDWVHDTTSRTMEHAEFYGHKYRVPWDSVKDNDAFKGLTDDEIKGAFVVDYETENEDGVPKVETLGGVDNTGRQQLRQYVELYDIFLPFEQELVTYAVDAKGTLLGDQEIERKDWDGPEAGPYLMLSFTDVPDNIMPLAPAALLLDLHNLGNLIFNKMGNRADRNKVVNVATRSASPGDAERIRDASDGDIVTAEADAIQEVVFGRQDPAMNALYIQVQEQFSKMGGNLDALGGLSQQADTLGQEKLIANSASVRVQHMSARVIDFVKDIIDQLAWYLWEDPLIELPMVKRVPGTDVEVPVNFSEETKEGDFLDYNFDIVPFSMTYLDPTQKAQRLMQLFGMMTQNQQGMMAQGVMPNYTEFFSAMQQLMQLEEFPDLLIYTNPSATPQGEPMVGEMPQKAQDANSREYVRRSVPGASGQGKDGAMMQTLLGGKPQASEMAALARPTSPPMR